jgi:hypothetical protein
LLHELKRWLYEHRILIAHDRLLKRLIVQAVQDVEVALTDTLTRAFGVSTLDDWATPPSSARWRARQPATLAVGRSSSQLDSPDGREFQQDRSTVCNRRSFPLAGELQRRVGAPLRKTLREPSAVGK